MLPSLTSHDLEDSRRSDVLLSCKSQLWFTCRHSRPNLSNVRFRQFGVTMQFAARGAFRLRDSPAAFTGRHPTSPLSIHVADIGAHRSNKQVVRSHAGWHVANVQDAVPGLNASPAASHQPRKNVCTKCATIGIESAIPVASDVARPSPAITDFSDVFRNGSAHIDLGPEADLGHKIVLTHRRVSSCHRDSGGQRSPAVSAAVGLARHFTTT